MVYDSVWWQAIGKLQISKVDTLWINLHISCLERVLGRRLRPQDFYYGAQLLKR